MSRQIFSQRYIYKINSSRFIKSKYNLKLDIKEASNNEELISLGDSQLLRFVRAITEGKNSYTREELFNQEEEITNIKNDIKLLKKKETNRENKKLISLKYDELYDKLLVKNIIAIVFESKAEFNKMTTKDGFEFNDKKYRRLLGTTGGLKQNTVYFCSTDIYEKLDAKINNGRKSDEPMIPAKLEAYKALSASSSTPVTQPRVLIIKDGTVNIKDDNVIYVSDGCGEDYNVDYNREYISEKDFCDGCGMATVKYMEQVAIDMGEYHLVDGKKVANYIPSGANTRYSFEKGMICTFEFIEFGTEVSKSYMVKDAWGIDRDIRNYDVILTTNMMKLCSSYVSLEKYIENCNKNGYLFSITKLCPKPEELEIKREMNYQYLQSYDFSNDDINELCSETIETINGALRSDYRKAILFLKGIHINDKDLNESDFDFIKALCIDKNMIDDPYVKQKIKIMIDKKIQDSKKGKIQIDGNYQIICGDLYALCQSMFGLEITGLLKSGEFYSNVWSSKGNDEIVVFRSPMTSKNNIRKLKLNFNNDIKKWFKHIKTMIVFNAWDTTTDALNGADFDSDAVISTNNNVMLRNTINEPTIICEQNSVPKKKVKERDLRKSNGSGFGNEVGTITNRVTSMFDVMATLDKNSDEYIEINRRIICGQKIQQDVIDKLKGIKAKGMPKKWHDYKSVKIKDEDNEITKTDKEFNLRILTNKKPYFFIYNYKHLKDSYSKFIKSIDNNCLMRFGLKYYDLCNKQDRTTDEEYFIRNTENKMPVFRSESNMNRICFKMEEEFSGIKNKVKKQKFDYKILTTEYKHTDKIEKEIMEIYLEYKNKVKEMSRNIVNIQSYDLLKERKYELKNEYRKRLGVSCNNEEELTNILIKNLYTSNGDKEFVWNMCGKQIIKNLLAKNNNTYTYPVLDKDGDIGWCGNKFKMKEFVVCEE